MKKALSIGTLLLAVSIPLSAAKGAQENVAPRSRTGRSGREARSDPASKRPDTAAEWFKEGMSLYGAKKFKEAIDAFKQAIRLGPADAKMHFNLGMAYYSLNQFREAAEEYKKAIRLDAKQAEAHYRLGWVSYVLGRKQEAQEQYEILRPLNSEYASKLYKIIRDEIAPLSASTVATGSKPPATKQPGTTTPLTTPLAPAASDPEPVVTSTLVASKNPPVETVAASSSDIEPVKSDPAPASSPATTTTNTVSTPAVAAPSPAATSDETAAPPTSIYRVGVGDVLDIRLLNSATNRSTLYTIMDGGVLDFTLAGGPITVAGMTTDEITARLAAELKRRKVEEGSQLVVSVRQYNSHSVIITGLVNNPGARVLRREAVPLYVVLAEAQLHTNAGRAVITRQAGTSTTVDLGDPAAVNTLVHAGDVISVTTLPTQYYYIAGRVNTPGQKIYQAGISLLQAILTAGGLSRSAETVEIYREDTTGRLFTFKFSLKDIKSGKEPDPRLLPGDRIEVGH